MPSIFMQKYGVGLAPVDEKGEDLMRRMKLGQMVRVDIRRPRNIKMHRLFWALMHKVFENQERYPTIETMVAAVKISLGECDTVVLPSGKPAYIPRSISFAKMGQDEFDDFFRRCCDMVAKHIIPGVTETELRREIEDMVGLSKRAA